MTFGFRLTVYIGPTDSLTSDDQELELDFGSDVGVVSVKGPLNDLPGLKAVMLTGLGYESRELATKAGWLVKDGLRAAAAERRVSIDVGEDQIKGGPGQILIDKAAEDGVLLLPDVHGLHVFEQTQAQVMTLRRHAVATKVVQLEDFLGTADRFVRAQQQLTEQQRLAIDLFGQSRMESSSRSRHLTLVTALEILSPRAPRQGLALQLLDEFKDRVEAALVDARARQSPADEVAELQSLMSAANDLREESIGAAIRNRVESLADNSAEGQANRSLASKVYTARSQLGHTGRTTADLNQYLMALETWIVKASLQPPGDSEAHSTE